MVLLSRSGHRTLRGAAVAAVGLALAVGGATATASAATTATGAATTTVNLRSGPGTSHSIRASLVRGQRITVTGTASAGWLRVSLGSTPTYVAAAYVDRVGALPTAPTRISTAGTKLATEDLNVRSGPGTGYRVVGSIRVGSRLTLTGDQRGGFAETRYAGHDRWVSVTYLAAVRGRTAAPAPVPAGARGAAALAYAKRQLGKPYVYAAEGPDAYDCSGLTWAAWRSVGVTLPRVARDQYAQGRHIARSQLRPGDLVFYYSQRPSHVAMYVGNGRVIHAPHPGRSVSYTGIDSMPYAGAVRPG